MTEYRAVKEEALSGRISYQVEYRFEAQHLLDEWVPYPTRYKSLKKATKVVKRQKDEELDRIAMSREVVWP